LTQTQQLRANKNSRNGVGLMSRETEATCPAVNCLMIPRQTCSWNAQNCQ